MSFESGARADLRALIVAASLGSAVGLALGASYLAGGMAHAVSTHAKIERLADAASDGFSDQALRADMGPSALSVAQVARRHDSGFVPSTSRRELQSAVLAARLERRSNISGLSTRNLERRHLMLQASYTSFNGDVVRAYPARQSNALRDARDLDCLTRAVYYEARGETPSGQAAVAQVVLNRVRHPAFPKTICGVVFQRAHASRTCQFSFACDGSQNARRDSVAWHRAERVAARALDGAVMTSVGNATHFHTTYVSPVWSDSLKQVAQIGLHVFYRFSGHPSAADAQDSDVSSPDAVPVPAGGVKPVYASLLPQMAPVALEPKAAAAPVKDTTPVPEAASAVKATETSQVTVRTPPAQPSSAS